MNRRKLIVLVIGLVALLTAFLVAYIVCRPEAAQGAKTLMVTVEHLNGADASYTLHTDAEYLRGALEEADLIDGTESAYGLYVLTVDGETANEANQEWWGYTINGEEAFYGVDSQPVYDNDRIVFTLNVGW